MPTENKFEVVKGKSAALALSKGITTLSYHLCFPADTDDEYDFRTKNNQERLDGGERGKDDAESENNNHRSALLLRKEKLEAEMEIKRSLGQVESSDQPTTKDFKTSSRSAADREDFAASVLVVDNDINKCGLNNRDVCKEIEVGHSLCQKKSSDQTPNITKDFKTSSDYDAETDHEAFAASLLPVDKDNDECRLNHREVGKEEPADKRLSELSRKRKQSSTEEEDCPPESVSRKKRIKRKCSAEGCTNGAVKGGVCIKHGAKRKLCSHEGCTNQAQNGGLCKRHGAKVEVKLCSKEGCTNGAVKGGVRSSSQDGVASMDRPRKKRAVDDKRNLSDDSRDAQRNVGRRKYARKLCSADGCMKFVVKGGVCARGMGHRSNYAAVKDAQIKLKKEECAKSMGQQSSDAAKQDVQIMLEKEECASSMGQQSSDAAKQDVQIKLSKEECASSMGQQSSDAAVQDAQIMVL